MITEVVKFRTSSGLVFDTRKQAEDYERKEEAYKDCLSILGFKRPESGGRSYIQHSQATVEAFISQVEDYLRAHETDSLADNWKENPRGFVGRLLDDSSLLGSRLYYRLASIDDKYREWDQPCFVKNPNENAEEVSACG